MRKMLAEERFREILKIVNEKKTVTVTELTELLDTSESTIRRDLTQLHRILLQIQFFPLPGFYPVTGLR